MSTSFTWNGQEVALLAGQGCLYIVAKSELIKNEEDTELQVCDEWTKINVTIYSN